MIVNSFILFQEFRNAHENNFPNFNSNCEQLEFRESLAYSLMGSNDKSFDSDTVGKCLPGFADKRKYCTYCNAEAIVRKKKLPSYKTSIFCQSC